MRQVLPILVLLTSDFFRRFLVVVIMTLYFVVVVIVLAVLHGLCRRDHVPLIFAIMYGCIKSYYVYLLGMIGFNWGQTRRGERPTC